jgi:hypothetical protein
VGTVSWPRIAGATSYKLLATRPSGSEEYVPYAGVNSLVGTVTDASCNPKTYCSISYDPAVALGEYRVPQLYDVNYIPILNFWPAPIVLGPGSNGYGGSGSAPGVLETDSMENPVVTARAWYKPFAWNTVRFENGADQTAVPNQIAYQRPMYMTSPEPGFILNGTMEPVQSSDLGRKGKLNFGGYSWGGTFITDLITCRDSAFLKTMAHLQLRPTSDPADCALGVVGPDIGFLRAKSKWRFYFNAIPAGAGDANAIELGGTGINLPSGSTYKIDGKPVTTVYSFAFRPTVVSRNTCSDQAVTVKGITTSNKLSEVTPPAPWGNVSVQVYPSAGDTLNFHFCNGTGSDAIPPSGTYSIIAF